MKYYDINIRCRYNSTEIIIKKDLIIDTLAKYLSLYRYEDILEINIIEYEGDLV